MQNYNLKFKIIFLAIIFFCLFGLAQSSEAALDYSKLDCGDSDAATWCAATCDQANVQTAINSASAGDTVFVPAGSCIWTTTVQNTPSVSITKSITLQGAGIDRTTITDGSNHDTGSEMILRLTGGIGKTIRVTGFTFNGLIDNLGKGLISITGGDSIWTGFRINNCKFNLRDTAIHIWGRSYGVIDHCTFEDVIGGLITINIWGTGFSNDANSLSFKDPSPLGTENATYVEDCTFRKPASVNYTGVMDSKEGGNYVFRYNTVYNGGVTNHETAYGANRGGRHFEIYENSFIKEGSVTQTNAINIRAGSGVIYNNTFTGKISNCITLNNYRTNDSSNVTPMYWGWCDGTNPADGNAAMTNGSGTHDGSNNATVLADSSKSWTTSQWVDYRAINTTDGSWCRITANDATTVTCGYGLATGTDNDWDAGDSYKITKGYPCFDQLGRITDQSGDAENGFRAQGGKHNGSGNASILTVTSANWGTNAYVGYKLVNPTDGSGCVITSNTSTTATCTLRGGVENDWDSGDWYRITSPSAVGPTQPLEPIYQWGNDFKGGACTYSVGGGCLNGVCKSDHLQANRDYYSQELVYTPYTYPHPLTLGDDHTPPSAPTGVVIE